MTLSKPTGPGSLAQNKDMLIEMWTRELLDYEPLKPYKLTPQQRRVIASLKWCVEVAKSNAHMGWTQQPPPIVGVDEKNRIVVQRKENNRVHSWALLRSGDPGDVTGKVTSLKDGREVEVK